jgi:hypothetical protein
MTEMCHRSERSEPFDPNSCLPTVTGYYSTADGRIDLRDPDAAVEVRIIPTRKIAADLSLIDSFGDLTLPLVASATATLLFRQFFLTIPDELVEGAKIDGA